MHTYQNSSSCTLNVCFSFYVTYNSTHFFEVLFGLELGSITSHFHQRNEGLEKEDDLLSKLTAQQFVRNKAQALALSPFKVCASLPRHAFMHLWVQA